MMTCEINQAAAFDLGLLPKMRYRKKRTKENHARIASFFDYYLKIKYQGADFETVEDVQQLTDKIQDLWISKSKETWEDILDMVEKDINDDI